MFNGVFTGIVSRFLGFLNFDEGILAVEGMRLMGAPLQEPINLLVLQIKGEWIVIPVAICCPLVSGVPGSVSAQKLMKLFPLYKD